MYAFSDPLKSAWNALLSPFGKIVQEISDQEQIGPIRICFDTDAETYQSSNLILGHTCGYPYVTRWNKSHRLVCVPQFDVAGCDGKHYSSWFVCGSKDHRDSIEAFEGGIAVINAVTSNSGMNVLRYHVSPFVKKDRFFNDVLISGSHLASLRAVAEGLADIAAIDAVSYHHIMRAEPALAGQTKIWGQSVKTTGLPFITRADESISCTVLCQALNRCIEESRGDVSEFLGLIRFDRVDDADYDLIHQLETDAKARGYPSLL